MRTLVPLPVSKMKHIQLNLDRTSSQDTQNFQGSKGGNIGTVETDAMEEERIQWNAMSTVTRSKCRAILQLRNTKADGQRGRQVEKV